MDQNDFEQQYTFDRGTYYSTPRWNDFTLDDERRAKKRFSRFFLAAVIYTLISYAVIFAADFIVLYSLGEEKALEIFNSWWYTNVRSSVAMYAIALPVLLLMTKGMRNTVRSKSKMKFSELVKIFLVGEAFMMVGSYIGNYLNLFIGAFIGKTPTNSVDELVSNSKLWFILLVVVVIGPIVEELIFRKLLMDKLGMYGDRLAIFVSAIAFGLFHANFYQLFYAMMLGAVLAYLYSKTSNIWYPIGLHMVINFLGSAIPMLIMDKITRFEELSNVIAGGAEITEEMMTELSQLSAVVGTYSLVNIGMLVAGLVIFFKNRRRIFVSDRCEICIPKERRMKVIFANVGVIAFLVVTGALTVLSLFN
ncbi:MAG: CPBP family intramembrane metalloprotease [Ruminococcaceae bacterium]|nr:CPBP family intramembrane metalloprotease [Oscillospiraceae bacterium]